MPEQDRLLMSETIEAGEQQPGQVRGRSGVIAEGGQAEPGHQDDGRADGKPVQDAVRELPRQS
jgi:hypothetical protein